MEELVAKIYQFEPATIAARWIVGGMVVVLKTGGPVNITDSNKPRRRR